MGLGQNCLKTLSISCAQGKLEDYPPLFKGSRPLARPRLSSRRALRQHVLDPSHSLRRHHDDAV
jgi:hypothetical protein